MTKLKWTLFALVLVFLVAGIATTTMLNRDPVYTPPANPDPGAILQAAQADT